MFGETQVVQGYTDTIQIPEQSSFEPHEKDIETKPEESDEAEIIKVDPKGDIHVHLTKREKLQVRKRWEQALIIKVFGSTVGSQFLIFKST